MSVVSDDGSRLGVSDARGNFGGGWVSVVSDRRIEEKRRNRSVCGQRARSCEL